MFSRRAFVLANAAALLCARQAPSWAASEQGVSGRPFSWSDAERRVQVHRAAVSADGKRVAVQVSRPFIDGGTYTLSSGPTIHPRCDIWLLDAMLEQPRLLPAHDLWVWAPAFSPDGQRVAALASKGDGQVGFIVWEIETGTSQLFMDVNVDIYARFSADGYAEDHPQARAPALRLFVWLDATTLLFVDHGAERQQFNLAEASAAETLGSRRAATARGETSVRVWGDPKQTCGVGRSVVRIDCGTRERATLYQGDVRGVSVSPDGRWLAMLVATGHLVLPEQAMPAALRSTTIGDDPMVSLKLTLAGINEAAEAPDINGFHAVGNVSPPRLPIWSSDNTRFAVPARSQYSPAFSTDDDVVWEIDVSDLRARSFPSRSALDAELGAALIAASTAQQVENTLRSRPMVRDEGKQTTLGSIEGGAWRYGLNNVLLWNAKQITLIGPGKSVQLPGEFTGLTFPITQGSHTRLQVQQEGRTFVLSLTGLTHRLSEIRTQPGWDLLNIRATDGALLYKQDAPERTSIVFASPERRPIYSPLKFNTHLAGILQPQHRELTINLPDGERRTGTLLMPVGRAPSDRHPVVIGAYPGYTPSSSSVLSPNRASAITYPFHYLLTQGFAVFYAPYPDAVNHRGDEPMQRTVDVVVPWLEVLARQPEILPGEYGFYGHSNGGYIGLSLAALTTQFKAIAVASTFPDLRMGLYSAQDKVALDCGGEVLQSDRFYYEEASQPYSLHAPPWKARDAFIRNSPVFNLEKASTPLLLIEGEFDFSPRDMEAVFSTLRGRGVPVELAYYWGEGHVLSSPGNIKDVWLRTERFFRKYLKIV